MTVTFQLSLQKEMVQKLQALNAITFINETWNTFYTCENRCSKVINKVINVSGVKLMF